jgi:ABC-type glycerol-3-phosphate transport system substrate-binding protein
MSNTTPLNLTLAHHGLNFSLSLLPQLAHRYPPSFLKTHLIDWSNLWSALRTSFISRKNMDVVELGSTWLGSLIGRNALQPLDASVFDQLGGSDIFTPTAWASVQHQEQAFAVPWLSDLRIILYWRDMVDDHADPLIFDSPEHLESVLEHLQARGMESPWGMPTERHAGSVHGIASWLWHYGSDFLDPDYSQISLTTAPSLQGADAYFRLGRFLPRTPDVLKESHIVNMFADRKIAMMMGATYVLEQLRRELPEEAYRCIGVTLPPGPTFIGGSNLALISQPNAEQAELILDLFAWLTSSEIQAELVRTTGLLPVRRDAYTGHFMEENEHHPVILHGLQTGKTLPIIKAWGSIEERLLQAYAHIWNKLRTEAPRSLRALLLEELALLEMRLNPMLKGGQAGASA